MINLPDINEILETQSIKTPIGEFKLNRKNIADTLNEYNRFGVDPRFLVYVPATMSPVETSKLDDYLEHPNEVFEYYQKYGQDNLIVEEKHMGCNTVIIVCKDESVGLEIFNKKTIGCIYSRTCKKFFKNPEDELKVLQMVKEDLEKNNVWEYLHTRFIVLACETKPWNFKTIMENQYCKVGNCAVLDRTKKLDVFKNINIDNYNEDQKDIILNQIKYQEEQLANSQKFINAYNNYCWDVNNLEDLRISPFWILATENTTYFDVDNLDHMRKINNLCHNGKILTKTKYWTVNLNSEMEKQDIIDKWIDYTSKGGEGFVFKTRQMLQFDNKGWIVQPAIKCRGREYLRLIYGIDYLNPEILKNLKIRHTSRKRKQAAIQHVLGKMSIEAFVRNKPLSDYHKICIASLSVNQRKLDPRL